MENDATIIGITGNIATGKSVIRRMLENSGCLGIDADKIAHRMIYPQGPAFQAVLKTFGEQILTEDGAVSRRKLGQIVFNNPELLNTLEEIIHPYVTESIQFRVHQSQCPIVVIEAIKLLEADLGELCDMIWVSHAPFDCQLDRLLHGRNMTEDEAKLRIMSQLPQSEKLSQADVVINTEGSFSSSWQQVQHALNDTIQVALTPEPQHINNFTNWTFQSVSELPLDQLDAFWHTNAGENPADLYENLGSHMILPLCKEDQLSSIIRWENWNFTASLQKVIPPSNFESMPNLHVQAFELHARLKQSEIMLLSDKQACIPGFQPAIAGFEFQTKDHLGYPAWQHAAHKIESDQEMRLWVKKLSSPVERLSNL